MRTEMEYKNILELWDRFEHSSADLFELEFQGMRLKWKRSQGQKSPKNCAGAADVSAAEPAAAGNAGAGTAGAGASAAAQTPAADASLREVLAPLVGTFYRAASPEEEPFVREGQKVRKGDVIGIIEAMKLMNEVTASEEGVVEEIPAENGALVSYHQVLVRLRQEGTQDV